MMLDSGSDRHSKVESKQKFQMLSSSEMPEDLDDYSIDRDKVELHKDSSH